MNEKKTTNRICSILFYFFATQALGLMIVALFSYLPPEAKWYVRPLSGLMCATIAIGFFYIGKCFWRGYVWRGHRFKFRG